MGSERDDKCREAQANIKSHRQPNVEKASEKRFGRAPMMFEVEWAIEEAKTAVIQSIQSEISVSQ